MCVHKATWGPVKGPTLPLGPWSPPVLWLGLENGARSVDAVSRLLKDLKIELPGDPAVPLLGISREELEVSDRYLYTHVRSSAVSDGQEANSPGAVDR